MNLPAYIKEAERQAKLKPWGNNAAMFSPRRHIHQNATTSEITGELPTEMYLTHAPLGYDAQRFMWCGNLDAPNLLPTGGCRVVYIDPAIGGMGFEGIAAANYIRGIQ